MALDKNEEDANAAFFNKQNNVDGGTEKPNVMTAALEEEHRADLGVTEPQGDDDFVVVNEEDYNPDDETDKDGKKTEEVLPEPVVDPQLSNILTSIEGLTELQKNQIETADRLMAPALEKDLEPEVDYSDPASVKNYVDWNTRESSRKVEESISKYHRENVAPMQNITLNRENQSQISEAKAMHGDRFDWNRDEAPIRKIQEVNPSLTVTDAFRHIDYQRIVDDNKNNVEKKAEMANSATVSSGPSSNQRATTVTTLVASKEDREMAKRFDMTIKDWMKSKYEQEQNPGASLI